MAIYLLSCIINGGNGAGHGRVVWSWERRSVGFFTPRGTRRVFVGLKHGESGQLEESGCEGTEGVFPNQFPDGSVQIRFNGSKKSLPKDPVFFIKPLPAIESPYRDVKDFADAFH
jgi:hypothetical protein